MLRDANKLSKMTIEKRDVKMSMFIN
jgi:hypothetical protein